MKPVEAYAEVGMLLEQTVKRVYRETPMTDQELDEWTDKILRWAEKQKKKSDDLRDARGVFEILSDFIKASDRVAAAMQRVGGAK